MIVAVMILTVVPVSVHNNSVPLTNVVYQIAMSPYWLDVGCNIVLLASSWLRHDKRSLREVLHVDCEL